MAENCTHTHTHTHGINCTYKIARQQQQFKNSCIERELKPTNTVSSNLMCLLNRNKNLGVKGEVQSSKFMLIKTGYPNHLQSCDFLCFYSMNY